MSTLAAAAKAAAPKLAIHFEGDKEYLKARKWGAHADKHVYYPGAIAYPTNAEEVSKLITWANEQGIELCLTNGGHGGVSFSKALVVRMDRICSVSVDPKAKTVTCGGGVTVGMVDAATRQHGLATTLGNCPMVGVTGAMLGGGTGFMARWQGLTIDQLLRATIVLADGSIVEASADSAHHDLFYALKGGGGNFGVLTSFTLRCFEIGWGGGAPSEGRLLGGMRLMLSKSCFCGLAGNAGGYRNLLTKFRDYTMSMPNELSADLMRPCKAPVAAQFLTYKGPIAEAKAEQKKWKHALGKAMISTIKVKSYFGIQGFVGRVAGKDMAKGMHERGVSMVVNLPDAAIEVLARAEQMAPSGCQAVIMCQRLGGKIDTPEGGAESCAYAHRGGGFWLVLQVVTSKVGKHEDPQKAALADAWLTNTCKELEPHVIEKGVGCISPGTTPCTQGAGAAVMFPPVNVFGEAARVEKLRAIKTKYDPTNVFKAVENGLTGAHNIEPDRV